MGRFFAALAIAALTGLGLGAVIGGFALIAALVVFGVACTLLLRPAPRPSPDDVPLGGPLVASLMLGVAAAPLAQRRPLATPWEASRRRGQAIEDAVGTAVDAAGAAVELGSAGLGNVIDDVTDD